MGGGSAGVGGAHDGRGGSRGELVWRRAVCRGGWGCSRKIRIMYGSAAAIRDIAVAAALLSKPGCCNQPLTDDTSSFGFFQSACITQAALVSGATRARWPRGATAWPGWPGCAALPPPPPLPPPPVHPSHGCTCPASDDDFCRKPRFDFGMVYSVCWGDGRHGFHTAKCHNFVFRKERHLNQTGMWLCI